MKFFHKILPLLFFVLFTQVALAGTEEDIQKSVLSMDECDYHSKR